ncbi:Tat pathway signal sequence domain protein [Paenibacillus phoenicis]
MSMFSTEDLIGSLIFLLILTVIAVWNLRKMSSGAYDLKALRKRGLVWTEVAVALFLLQLLLRKGDNRFLLVLGMVVLFAASQWLGAIYLERKENRGEKK